MIKHLAIFNAGDAQKIFSGKRKIEGRFSQIKIAPFAKVFALDIVLVKTPGEKIIGQFIVDRVLYFDHPRQEEFNGIKRKYGKDLALSGTFPSACCRFFHRLRFPKLPKVWPTVCREGPSNNRFSFYSCSLWGEGKV